MRTAISSTTDVVQNVFYQPDVVYTVSTRCSEVCKTLYLLDSAQTMSTPGYVWQEDRTHPITQGSLGRQQQHDMFMVCSHFIS